MLPNSTPVGSTTQQSYSRRLEKWSFNPQDRTNPWVSQNGTPPATVQKVKSADSFDGMALLVDRTDGGLNYPGFQKNGTPTIACESGTVRFFFKPNWNSGVGPGRFATAFAVGRWTPAPPTIGYFGLNINPKGTRIMFGSQNRGQGSTYLVAPLDLKAGKWHEIMLTYTPKESFLFIDGSRYGPGTGVLYPPSREARMSHGLTIGNNVQGTQPVHGIIDEFETFRAPLIKSDLLKRFHVLSATVSADPPTIKLSWEKDPGRPVDIKRKAQGENTWKQLVTGVTGLSYTDQGPDLKVGIRYEYQVGDRHITTAIQGPPIEDRGEVILLVSEDVSLPLSMELGRFEQDLVGDGWHVFRSNVPRHDDRRWEKNPAAIANLKQIIRARYHLAPEANHVVILIGHVPIPYSGYRPEDGHKNHSGAWPCDAYYADLDSGWTDEGPAFTKSNVVENYNLPGDGKFDQDTIQSDVELAVGRIDFARLPALNGKRIARSKHRGQSLEVELLRQYLDKNHSYRHHRLVFPHRAVVQSLIRDIAQSVMIRNGFRNASRWFGFEDGALSAGNFFSLESPALWGFLAGYGGSQSIASGRYRTTDFLRAENEPQVGFMMLLGSWFGDWNLKDNFMRATMTMPRSGLAVMSALSGDWRLEEMALGASLSDGYVRSVNQPLGRRRVRRSFALLGDPTLRLQVTPPIDGLKGRESPDGSLTLEWKSPQGESHGVFVYHATSPNGPYSRIAEVQNRNSVRLTEATPSIGDHHYMLRRTQLVETGSGSFTNLSQGTFWSP